MCPLDLAFRSGVILIMERPGRPWAVELILSVSGKLSPSADANASPRDPTKGCVEARSHKEKNDRRDLVSESATTERSLKSKRFTKTQPRDRDVK